MDTAAPPGLLYKTGSKYTHNRTPEKICFPTIIGKLFLFYRREYKMSNRKGSSGGGLARLLKLSNRSEADDRAAATLQEKDRRYLFRGEIVFS